LVIAVPLSRLTSLVGGGSAFFVRHMSIARQICWFFLFAGLVCVLGFTLNYFDPPATDPLMMRFLKSGQYLPAGDTFSITQVAGSVSRLLEVDREGYRHMFFASLVSFIAALGLALIPRKK
jgi:hypothetical protein